ncbi:MAG TPA: tetratricopeptide repeat protein [Planctomycetaceae bacterium]|nr:tetratricopeptide repeat protein [Planctomycetaceae bacterium]
MLAVALAAGGGCAMPSMRVPFLADRAAEEERMTSIAGVRGPTERVLAASGAGRAEGPASLESAAGAEEYRQAEDLYRAGEFAQAEKSFRRIAKKYKGSQVQEDALFMIGECQFERNQFAKAQDSYDKLLNEFPSSRHLDRAGRRLFLIAQSWLEFPEVVVAAEIQQVDYENPRATPPPTPPRDRSNDPSRRIPIFPNVWNRTRPVFDTNGRALEALKSIWLKDPTGPLADDALMMTASHHVRNGNYMEAARHYEMLIEQYPKSEHLKDAFQLCAHATAMSHQGPLYDGHALTRSRELKQSTMRLFPDQVDRERILDEIRRIDEEKAGSEWANVEFWQRKRDPVAAAASAREVVRLYPNSTYAARAREVLATLEAEQQPAPAPSDGQPRRFFWQRGDEYEEPQSEQAPPELFPGEPGRASL